MGNTLPLRERIWRTLAAAAIAPATLVLLYVLQSAGYLMHPEHVSKFFPGLLVWSIAMSYACSALIGGAASVLRCLLQAPLRAGVVVSLFAASAAPWGLLTTDDWLLRSVVVALGVILSLPVSITYCAIAGIKWR
jgi:hypothetical protein